MGSKEIYGLGGVGGLAGVGELEDMDGLGLEVRLEGKGGRGEGVGIGGVCRPGFRKKKKNGF